MRKSAFLFLSAAFLFTSSVAGLSAQETDSPSTQYKIEAEATVQGTLQKATIRTGEQILPGVVQMVTPNNPDLLVHLGPSADRILEKVNGRRADVRGSMVRISDRTIFLVREIVVGGETLTIRNRNGIVIIARGAIPRTKLD